jgi:ATP-dependent DNA ligase
MMHKSLENLPKNARVKLKETALPNWIAPMLATLTHDHFFDPDWVFERKLDGHRCLFFKEGNDLRLMTWITPHFVGEVGFTEWTCDGKLRHPRFLGLRKDKEPKDVVRDD